MKEVGTKAGNLREQAQWRVVRSTSPYDLDGKLRPLPTGSVRRLALARIEAEAADPDEEEA